MSDCAQVRLHQALTLVQHRDLAEGIRHASAVIATLPASQRRDMVFEVARHVLAAVPAGERGRPDVRELRDLLTVPMGTAST
ncbi:MAG: hypothetical protein HKP61_17105 [Dactylosporangium sp.]|nr:hypothetical protein [Dactylosporangium sp.]NNJ62625.1 hypothetical protein [Dactylosporangium sp.]